MSSAKANGGSEQRSPYETVRDGILDGTFPGGSQLVELTIAERCGVSRTPVREAFTRLEQEGLAERGSRGLVVRVRSPEEILDIYETRIALEATAARLAAERHTEIDRVRLERALAIYERTDVGKPKQLATANDQFHQTVWQASRNESLTRLLNVLRMQLARYPETTLAFPGRGYESKGEHRMIFEAIVAGDDEKAAALAEQHFRRARDIRIALWGTE
jgi:DNA-binding GntR family transcriptional regulator